VRGRKTAERVPTASRGLPSRPARRMRRQVPTRSASPRPLWYSITPLPKRSRQRASSWGIGLAARFSLLPRPALLRLGVEAGYPPQPTALLTALHHGPAEAIGPAELPQQPAAAVLAEVGEQDTLAWACRVCPGGFGCCLDDEARARHPASRLPTLAQPARRQGAAQAAENAGVAGEGDPLDQLLPGFVHGGPLHDGLHRPDRLPFQSLRTIRLAPDHQTGLGPALQPHPHQIAACQPQSCGIGVGEAASLRTGLQPDMHPGGCCRGQAVGYAGVCAAQSCRRLSSFLRWTERSVHRAAAGTGESSIQDFHPGVRSRGRPVE